MRDPLCAPPRCLVAALLALLVLAPACSTLPDFTSGSCGNGVIDPGEDCDGFADPALGDGLACGAPGDLVRQCHYQCTPGSATAKCPSGWGCGPDGLCRHASGEFVAAANSPFRLTAPELAVGDVDGDHLPDVIAFSGAALGVRFGAAGGQFGTEADLSTDFAQGVPAYGDLDGDGRLDVVVPQASGLFVALGQADRTLAPVAYSSIAVKDNPPKGMLVLPVKADVTVLGDQPLIVGATLTGVFLKFLGKDKNGVDHPATVVNGAFVIPPVVPGPLEKPLAGRIPRAFLDGANAPQTLALSFVGDDKVSLIQAQRNAATLALTMKVRQTVQLPKGVLYGVRFADVDGDGDLDLLISLAGDQVAIALNDGAANFGAPVIDPAFDQIGAAVAPAPAGQHWPLAVAPLNTQDGVSDYVGTDGVYIRIGGTLARTAFNTGQPWGEAEIADFNHDGVADVAVSTTGQVGIDFLLGNGSGIFNRFHVGTSDPPFDLRAADFDGDFVSDLAVALRDPISGHADQLAVLYGSTQGAPSNPVSMGRLDRIDVVEPGNLVFSEETFDVTSDLIVQSTSATGKSSLALLIGSSQRRMLAPFSLEPRLNKTDVPIAVAIGQFDSSGDAIPDLVALAPPDVWLIKGSGGAGFLAEDAHFVTLDPTTTQFNAACGLFLSATLGATPGHDAVLALDNGDRCSGSGAQAAPSFLVATAHAGPGGADSLQFTSTPVPGDFRVPHEMKLADLDGDGFPELIVTYLGQGAPAAAATLPPGAGVVVYWNDHGTLRLDGASVIPTLPGATQVWSAAAINVDDDKQLELAILTDRGVFTSKFDPKSLAFAEPSLAIPEPGILALEAADVDADGLSDLIFTGQSGQEVEVWLSVPFGTKGGK